MSTRSTCDIVIRIARPNEWPAAMRLVLAPRSEAERPIDGREFLRQAAAGRLPMDRLVVACRGEWIVGAGWANVLSGRCAAIWVPRVVQGESGAVADRILGTLHSLLVKDGVHLVQSLLPMHDVVSADYLLGQEYRAAGDLDYMVCMSTAFPKSLPVTPLQFEPYRAQLQDRLIRVVEQTYRETKDCPELNGMRETRDVLNGYRQAGPFEPDQWLLVRHRQSDVGCLLLTDHAEHDQVELIYMGLVPAVRGRGWGGILVEQAQWIARRRNRPRIVLAVDHGNWPGRAIYAAAGFASYDQRRVFVKDLRPSVDTGG